MTSFGRHDVVVEDVKCGMNAVDVMPSYIVSRYAYLHNHCTTYYCYMLTRSNMSRLHALMRITNSRTHKSFVTQFYCVYTLLGTYRVYDSIIQWLFYDHVISRGVRPPPFEINDSIVPSYFTPLRPFRLRFMILLIYGEFMTMLYHTYVRNYIILLLLAMTSYGHPLGTTYCSHCLGIYCSG